MRLRVSLSHGMAFILTALASLPLFASGNVSGRLDRPGEGGVLNLTFSAQSVAESGDGSGTLSFSTSVALPDTDEDDPYAQERQVHLTLDVSVDCVKVSGSRAAMSGPVRNANIVGYDNRRLVVVVEDGGTGAPDKFTWALVRTSPIRWVPTDAEREFDEGAGAVWFTRDAERDDEQERLVGGERPETDCRSFPLSAYDLIDVRASSGDLSVTQ